MKVENHLEMGLAVDRYEIDKKYGPRGGVTWVVYDMTYVTERGASIVYASKSESAAVKYCNKLNEMLVDI